MSTGEEISALRQRVAQLEQELAIAKAQIIEDTNYPDGKEVSSDIITSLPLSLPEYRRYGRQMILDGFGLPCRFIPCIDSILYLSKQS